MFPHYQWFFVAPWIQDDWRVNNKLTVNLGFRWDFNGAVQEADNKLNYAFDPTIVNPVSARSGSRCWAGSGSPGVNGAPTQPWKYDKNNYQFRAGMAYSINEQDRVPRRIGQVLPQSDQPVVQRRVRDPERRSSRRTTAAARRPTCWGIPCRTASRQPPGSSLGPLTFLGRNPSFSNPDFIVPNVHQFSVGIAARAAGAYLARRDLRGQPEPRHRGELRRLQRAVRGVPGAVRRDARRQPHPLRPAGAEPVLQRPRLRGHDPVHEPDALRVRARAGRSRRSRGFNKNQQNLGKMTYDSMQFVANKRWAKGVTINAGYTWVPRWTEDRSEHDHRHR